MARNGRKMAICKLQFLSYFSHKIEKKMKLTKIVFYVVVFDQKGFRLVGHIKMTVRTSDL